MTDKMSTATKRKSTHVEEEALIGDKLSFAAKEAYKLLRTNLMFALSDAEEGRGHIIGVTSSLRGEGKSTTTVNLACVLAEQGKKILIVEGDLRLPSIRKKLKIRTKTGLCDALVARTDPSAYIQPFKVGIVDNRPITFDLLTAGSIPPNPSELLGSKRMEDTLKELSKQYDFILLDLPPVTAVTDALVATKLVDGVVMVVRNEYVDIGSLNEAIRQIKLVDGKILGFVFTCADGGRRSYRRKYRYRYYKNNYKYGYKYGYGYGYGYGEKR